MTVQSWGRYPRVNQQVHRLPEATPALPEVGGSVLPHGMGRSYGDSCLNEGGTLLLTRGMRRLLAFDPERGTARCEAGMTLAELLEVCVPRGWFPPVLPGTRHVTIGGAIANDVHGKNHHRHGSFGVHVRAFELLRSDGTRRVVTPADDPAWFRATIGGLGLTGLITWAEIALRRVGSPWMRVESLPFSSLEEFLDLSAASSGTHPYTVGWLDAAGRNGGEPGLLLRGDHVPAEEAPPPRRSALASPVPVPFGLPRFAFRRPLIRRFNRWWRHRSLAHGAHLTWYDRFFFPLDALTGWNRLYGRRGFLQYQCVLPMDGAARLLRDLLGELAGADQVVTLAVLKEFGADPAPGLLSFPRRGLTAALDLPITGPATFAALERLDRILLASGGAVYPAKDARMGADAFRAFYPEAGVLERYRDPAFSSSFWRRVTA